MNSLSKLLLCLRYRAIEYGVSYMCKWIVMILSQQSGAHESRHVNCIRNCTGNSEFSESSVAMTFRLQREDARLTRPDLSSDTVYSCCNTSIVRFAHVYESSPP